MPSKDKPLVIVTRKLPDVIDALRAVYEQAYAIGRSNGYDEGRPLIQSREMGQ